MGREGLAWIGAVAGAALVVLLFLTWYELDPSALQGSQEAETTDQNVLGYLNTYSAGDTGSSAWTTLPRISLVWALCGGLAVAAALAVWLGAGALVERWVLAAGALAGVAALGLALLRLIDPPLESYAVRWPAYAAALVSAVVAAVAVSGLRRA